MRLAFGLCHPASAYSAFAFQKEFAGPAQRGEGLLIRILSFYQKLLLGSELGPNSEFFPCCWLIPGSPWVKASKVIFGLFHMHMLSPLDSWDKEVKFISLFTQSGFIRYLKCARLTSRTYFFITSCHVRSCRNNWSTFVEAGCHKIVDGRSTLLPSSQPLR